jgi:hypothetical protein
LPSLGSKASEMCMGRLMRMSMNVEAGDVRTSVDVGSAG